MEILGANSYQTNVRYQVAKGQIDQLFLKWISASTTDQLIQKLLTEMQSGQPGTTLTAPPSPLFLTKMQKQPNSPTSKGLTPPRSPSAEKYGGLGRTFSPKQSSFLLDSFKIQPTHNNFTNEAPSDPYNAQFSKSDATALKSMVKGGQLDFGDFQAMPSKTPTIESEKQKQTSPRSPVGRTDKRKERSEEEKALKPKAAFEKEKPAVAKE